TGDVNLAMEASLNTQNAYKVASTHLEESQNKKMTVSVKRVVDFSFQDVKELVTLVQNAHEAIHHQGFKGNDMQQSAYYNDFSKLKGMVDPLSVYSTVGKLSKICVEEYEKQKEMAAAALAYKCMEVTYMRVVYCKSFMTKQDMQMSMQMVTQDLAKDLWSKGTHVVHQGHRL
nr:cullin, conserved site-containing protein [Tanacetum cinerariifolium]